MCCRSGSTSPHAVVLSSFDPLREPSENVHLAFPVRDRATVSDFHRAALAAGYRDNGPPGERRYHAGCYGAFVLDPDGNNIEAVHGGMQTRWSRTSCSP